MAANTFTGAGERPPDFEFAEAKGCRGAELMRAVYSNSGGFVAEPPEFVTVSVMRPTGRRAGRVTALFIRHLSFHWPCRC